MQNRRTTKNPILVTGPHRSGTTWIGKILASVPRTGYIHEPFNISHNWYYYTRIFDHWFQYINDHNDIKYFTEVQRTIDFNLKHPFIPGVSFSNIFKYIKKYSKFKYYKTRQFRPIIKDPIAFFSAEWISSRFNCDVIITMRHPASFIASLKKKGWLFDFSNFLLQEELMERLSPFSPDIKAMDKGNNDIIDQGILLWRIFSFLTSDYQRNNSEWLFLKHEDIIANPIKMFKNIFSYLDLDYSMKVENFLSKTISKKNPEEVQKTTDIYRDISSLGKLWTKRLDEDEILKIKNGVADLYNNFYTAADWVTYN